MQKYTSLTPNLMVQDVRKSAEFYINTLGFELLMAVPESQDTVLNKIPEDKNIVYALLQSWSVQIMLQEENTLKKDIQNFTWKNIGATISLYMDVENIDELYKSLLWKIIIIKDLSTTWYGMREFYITDIDGYVLGFAEAKK